MVGWLLYTTAAPYLIYEQIILKYKENEERPKHNNTEMTGITEIRPERPNKACEYPRILTISMYFWRSGPLTYFSITLGFNSKTNQRL